MSRIGQMPITLPPGVKVSIKENRVTVAGPKGELSLTFNPAMTIAQQDNTLIVSRPSDEREHRALHGLTRSLVANMVTGVSSGFEKSLEVFGVGYRAEKSGDNLVLRLGFSHPVVVTPLPGISFTVDGSRIKVSGNDKELVGEIAARIRRLRPPDAYKGKGIKYIGEAIKLKPGKAGKAVGKQ